MSRKKSEPSDGVSDAMLPGHTEAMAVAPVASESAETPEQIEKRLRAEALKAEPKDVKFRRLANPRLNAAEKAILRLCPLSNRAAYSSTPEQVQEMLSVLTAAVNAVRSAYQRSEKPAQRNRL